MNDLAQLSKTHIDWELTPAQLAAFDDYERLLVEWNTRLNLTALLTPEQIHIQHFLDSLTCLHFLRSEPAAALIDVGTGAGLPGLALKIVLPDLRVTLVDSVGKKIDFCRLVAETLGMSDVLAVKARAEEIGRDPSHRERYEWAVARAVGPFSVVMEYLLPLVRRGGHALAQRGQAGSREADEALPVVALLGGTAPQAHTVQLPGLDQRRTLIAVRKVAPTPAEFPRRVGVPAKRPLL